MKINERTLLFPSVVRGMVLEQHKVLRQMFQRALDETTRSLRREGLALEELAELATDLRQRFRAHLAFEERMLAPVLAHIDLWGPERVSALLEEHARQRAEVDTIVEGLQTDWDVERLALVMRSLVTDLLRDMDEEEAGCLSASFLGEDVVAVDRVAIDRATD
jgi:hypothetical protein